MQPNTVSYNSLLSACERCGQADRALEVFSMMEREAAPTFGYTASSLVTYNILISACGKAGMYGKVCQIFQEMQGKGIKGDVFTLCGLIIACEKVLTVSNNSLFNAIVLLQASCSEPQKTLMLHVVKIVLALSIHTLIEVFRLFA